METLQASHLASDVIFYLLGLKKRKNGKRKNEKTKKRKNEKTKKRKNEKTKKRKNEKTKKRKNEKTKKQKNKKTEQKNKKTEDEKTKILGDVRMFHLTLQNANRDFFVFVLKLTMVIYVKRATGPCGVKNSAHRHKLRTGKVTPITQ